MSSLSTKIPLGFRFEPTDEELVKGFLWPRLTGRQLPWNGILEKEIYGDNATPWAVFDDASTTWHTKREGGATKKTVYAFTTLTKVSKASNSNSKKISRKAGCGTWSGQTGPKEIISSDTGEVIGNMRMFSFQCRKSDAAAASSDSGHWIMHEYFLSDVFAKLSGHPNAGDFVLCKITKIIKDCRGHRSQPVQLIPPAVENKKRGREEIEQEGCKKQKCGGEGSVEAEDWNDIDLDNLIFDLDSM